MHQKRRRLGLHSTRHCRSFQRALDPLAVREKREKGAPKWSMPRAPETLAQPLAERLQISRRLVFCGRQRPPLTRYTKSHDNPLNLNMSIRLILPSYCRYKNTYICRAANHCRRLDEFYSFSCFYNNMHVCIFYKHLHVCKRNKRWQQRCWWRRRLKSHWTNTFTECQFPFVLLYKINDLPLSESSPILQVNIS